MSTFKIDASSRIIGTMHFGENVYIAQGSVVRSSAGQLTLGASTWVLENSVLIGTGAHPLKVGSKTVFGHKCIAIGATIGELCEIGNGVMMLPGSKIGNRCIFGEGTLVPEGMVIPDESVVIGRPARILRQLNAKDHDMIFTMRGNNTTLPSDNRYTTIEGQKAGDTMGKCYSYNNIFPTIATSTQLFDTAEITGDVIIGEHCVIGAGVKIIGNAHGPVHIGDHVQILENTVLHLLPNNSLDIHDHVTIGPGCIIHGTTIGAHSVIESGAIVCDDSVLGENTLVKAGTLVKQRDIFEDNQVLEGFPAKVTGTNTERLMPPDWGLIPS